MSDIKMRFHPDDRDATIADLEAKLREAEGQRDEFKRIGQGFEREARQFFDQSCANLARATTAEAQIAAEREAVKKIIGLISNALGQRHVLEAHRRTIERFHNDPAIKLQDELDTISLCGYKIHHLLVEAQDLVAAAVKAVPP